MQVKPLLLLATAVKFQLWPHAMPKGHLLHKSLPDVDFTMLANTGYIYCYPVLGKFQPSARQPQKIGCNGKTIHPKQSPLISSNSHVSRAGKQWIPLCAAKDDK